MTTTDDISKLIAKETSRVFEISKELQDLLQGIEANRLELEQRIRAAVDNIDDAATDLASDLEQAREDAKRDGEDANQARDDWGAALDLIERLAEIAHRHEPAEVEYALNRFAADGHDEQIRDLVPHLRVGRQVENRSQTIALQLKLSGALDALRTGEL